MTDVERNGLIEKVRSLQETLGKAESLVNPVRPTASDLTFSCAADEGLGGQEVMPGKTVAQAAEECGDAVEKIAALLATASGCLTLLDSAIGEATSS